MIPLEKFGPETLRQQRPALTTTRLERTMAKPIPTPIPDDVKARLWAKIDKRGPDECWPWLSTHNEKGYARVSWRRKNYFVHRLAYVIANGSIGSEDVIDHLCRNRGCVNPSHLEAVTVRQNTLRGVGPTAQYAISEFCPNGHPRVEGNISPYSLRIGQRACRECHKERSRLRRKRMTAERRAKRASRSLSQH